MSEQTVSDVVPADLYDAAQQVAQSDGTTVSALAAEALTLYLGLSGGARRTARYVFGSEAPEFRDVLLKGCRRAIASAGNELLEAQLTARARSIGLHDVPMSEEEIAARAVEAVKAFRTAERDERAVTTGSAPAPSDDASRRLILGGFLASEERQADRHEFVDGRVTIVRSGTQASALIAANLVGLLRPLLGGSACRLGGPSIRLPTPGTGNSRYADLAIDCGRFEPAANDASEPIVIFDVLSESTGWYEQAQRVKDYASVASIRQYVCISQSAPRISVWLRDGGGRLIQQEDLVEIEAELIIVGFQRPLRVLDIYEGIGLADSSSSDVTA